MIAAFLISVFITVLHLHLLPSAYSSVEASGDGKELLKKDHLFLLEVRHHRPLQPFRYIIKVRD
jgi:hypothetical protein